MNVQAKSICLKLARFLSPRPFLMTNMDQVGHVIPSTKQDLTLVRSQEKKNRNSDQAVNTTVNVLKVNNGLLTEGP